MRFVSYFWALILFLGVSHFFEKTAVYAATPYPTQQTFVQISPKQHQKVRSYKKKIQRIKKTQNNQGAGIIVFLFGCLMAIAGLALALAATAGSVLLTGGVITLVAGVVVMFVGDIIGNLGIMNILFDVCNCLSVLV